MQRQREEEHLALKTPVCAASERAADSALPVSHFSLSLSFALNTYAIS